MNNKDKEQLDNLIHSFEALLDNPAYKHMLKIFDASCLDDTNPSDMQTKAEKYIAESAVKKFIRDIALYARGLPDELVIDDVFLEDENEEIDENEDVFSD